MNGYIYGTSIFEEIQLLFFTKIVLRLWQRVLPWGCSKQRPNHLVQFNSESIILRILIENPVHSQTCCMDKKNINFTNAKSEVYCYVYVFGFVNTLKDFLREEQLLSLWAGLVIHIWKLGFFNFDFWILFSGQNTL